MRLRLFLTCWIVFSLHFATNIVREHYPAFSLIEDGDFKLDNYAGWHPDIFEHRDGHHYIGNQVTASVFAAVPLLLFDPLLDYLEEVGLRRAATAPPSADFDTEHPLRRAFFLMVSERGLVLRLGATAVVTSVFLMAPVAAFFALLMFDALSRRGVSEHRALWLSLLFAFGTPIFYRVSVLNHNMFLALAVFGSFLLLWPGLIGNALPSTRRRAWAGSLAGLCVALDYAGAIPLLWLFAYLLYIEWQEGGLDRAWRAAPAFILGSVPPVLFLLWSQWVTFGDPFLPGQLWMPDQNVYVGVGVRGFTLPDPEIFYQNLFDLDWGLYTFAPILLLGLLPARFAPRDPLVFPRPERWATIAFLTVFMLFCASNQYSRLQFNTGFRYLLPLVPFIFLALCDHLVAMKPRFLIPITAVAVMHTWVLTMVRALPPSRGAPQAIPTSWDRFLTEGVQFGWLNVVTSTPSIEFALLRSAAFPYLLLAIAGTLIFGVWKLPIFAGTKTR